MTIILAIPTKDGVVLASDGQITSGEIRAHGKKIKELNKNCLWGAAGRESLIQRVEEKITLLADKENQLRNIRDHLAQNIKGCTLELFGMDQQLPQEEFVFVEYLDKPSILHITTNGTPEWIRTGPFGIGIGRTFVHALLQKYQELIPEKIDIEKGTLLAYKAIEEAIEVGAYGLGLPIDIWQISKPGVKNLNIQEIEKIKNDCCALRNLEIKMLLKNQPGRELANHIVIKKSIKKR